MRSIETIIQQHDTKLKWVAKEEEDKLFYLEDLGTPTEDDMIRQVESLFQATEEFFDSLADDEIELISKLFKPTPRGLYQWWLYLTNRKYFNRRSAPMWLTRYKTILECIEGTHRCVSEYGLQELDRMSKWKSTIYDNNGFYSEPYVDKDNEFNQPMYLLRHTGAKIIKRKRGM